MDVLCMWHLVRSESSSRGSVNRRARLGSLRGRTIKGPSSSFGHVFVESFVSRPGRCALTAWISMGRGQAGIGGGVASVCGQRDSSDCSDEVDDSR